MKAGWTFANAAVALALAAGCGRAPLEPSLDLTRPECERRGGRCQSPDLRCMDGFHWAGYDLCGDAPNDSCCLPDAGS